MYYYPSMCSSMNNTVCVSVQYPQQDVKTYFISDSFNNGSLNGEKISQLRTDQAKIKNMKRTRGSQDYDEDNNTSNENLAHLYGVRKSTSDSAILNHNKSNDEVIMCDLDGDNNQISDDEMFEHGPKRMRTVDQTYNNNNSENNQESAQWPVFKHPNGGIVQITPHGNVRTYFDNGIEVSVMEKEGGWCFGN